MQFCCAQIRNVSIFVSLLSRALTCQWKWKRPETCQFLESELEERQMIYETKAAIDEDIKSRSFLKKQIFRQDMLISV